MVDSAMGVDKLSVAVPPVSIVCTAIRVCGVYMWRTGGREFASRRGRSAWGATGRVGA